MTFEDPRFPRSQFLPAEQVQRGDTPSEIWRYGEILPPAVTAPTHGSESPNAEGSAEDEAQGNEVSPRSKIQSDNDTDSSRTLTGDVRNPEQEYLDSASDGWHTPRTESEPKTSHTAPHTFSDSSGGHVAPKSETESMDKSEPNDIEILLQSYPVCEPSSKIESSKPQDTSQSRVKSNVNTKPNGANGSLPSSPAHDLSPRLPPLGNQATLKSKNKRKNKTKCKYLPAGSLGAPNAESKSPPNGNQGLLHPEMKLPPISNMGALSSGNNLPPIGNHEPLLSNVKTLQSDMRLPPIDNQRTRQFGIKLPPIGNQEALWSQMKSIQSEMQSLQSEMQTHQFEMKSHQSEMKSLHFGMKSLESVIKSFESERKSERKPDIKRVSNSHDASMPSSADEVILSSRSTVASSQWSSSLFDQSLPKETANVTRQSNNHDNPVLSWADEVIMSQPPVEALPQRRSSPFDRSQSQPAPKIPDLIDEQHRPGFNDLATGALDPASIKSPQADYVENSVTDHFEESQKDQFKMVKSKAQQKKEKKKAQQNLKKAKKRTTAPPLLSLAARDRIEKEKAARQLAEVLMKLSMAPPAKPPVKSPAKMIEAPSETVTEMPPAKTIDAPPEKLRMKPRERESSKPILESAIAPLTTPAMEQPEWSSLLKPLLERPAKLMPTEYLPLPTVEQPAAEQRAIEPTAEPIIEPAVGPYIEPTVEATMEAFVEPIKASMSPFPNAEVTSHRAERNLEANGRPKRHRRSDPSPESPPFADSDFPTQNPPKQRSQKVTAGDRYWRLDVGDGDAPYHYLLSRTSQNPHPDGSRRIEHLEVPPFAW